MMSVWNCPDKKKREPFWALAFQTTYLAGLLTAGQRDDRNRGILADPIDHVRVHDAVAVVIVSSVAG